MPPARGGEDLRTGADVDEFFFEVRYAARRLRHAPGFALVVILTLALGIGANSAIFSVVNAVLLRPLPFKAPEQLVTVYHDYPSIKLQASVSAAGFRDYRDRTHSYDGVFAQLGWNVNVTGVGEPERLRGSRVSGLFFSTLGVPAARGRTLMPEEDAVGRDHEVVLSDGLWRRLFGANPAVLNTKVSLNGEPFEVAGVMPPEFIDPRARDIEIWAPLALDPALFANNRYTNEFLAVTARLKPGVTFDQASKDLDGFAKTLKTELPDQFAPDWGVKMKTLTEDRTGNIRPALLVLLGAVGFVLLIACANVANLLLARAASRQKEVAIRTALGAGRWSLVRQLLVESLLLSGIGGVVGLALAWASVRALVAINPGNIPGINTLSIDGRVVAFTAAVAVCTGLLFGLVPALQTTRADLHGTLKEGGRSGTADRAGLLVRRTLVVAEVALALALLTGGGLLLRSFARLSSVDPGFTPGGLLTFNLSLPRAKYATDTTRRAFFAQLMPRLAAVPGVVAAGATDVVPFGGGFGTASFNVEGYTPPPKGNSPWGDMRLATPEYFATMQVPKRAGRWFDARDEIDAPPVVIVDEELVKRFIRPGTDPLGQRIWFGPNPPAPTTKLLTIVGVVPHVKQEGLDADSRVQVYFPVAQQALNGPGLDVLVRTKGDPLAMVGAVRAAIHEIDRDMPLARIRTMNDLLESSLGQRRLSTVLLGVFAGIALLLASLGIYGVMSYTVAQRTRELGVRVALGASRESLLGLVMRQGMTLALFGVGIGLAGAFALTRLLRTQLYGVTATDPLTFLGVTLTLTTVAVAATLVPALRATRIDPIVALREE